MYNFTVNFNENICKHGYRVIRLHVITFYPNISTGMGYPSLARGGVTPLFNQMMEQGVVTDPMFSFWISKNRTSSVGGLLTLGGYNSQFFTGDIAWSDVSVQDYWQIDMEGMSVEGRKGTIACDRVGSEHYAKNNHAD